MHNIFCFHVELARGCTRCCDFCAINSIKNEIVPPTLMSIELAADIAKQIKEDFKEKLRVDFSLHGEPLLNPNANEIIKVFRQTLPKAQLAVISNGDLIARDKVNLKSLFDSGLNYLMLDFYKRSEKESGVLVDNIEGVYNFGVGLYDYFEDKKSIWTYNGFKEKAIIIVKDLSTTNVTTRKVHTAGGNIPEKAYETYSIDRSVLPLKRQCSKPFTELSVNVDGNVSLCCEDWTRKEILGNLLNGDKLINIWTSEKLEKYRYLLNQKRRDLIEVCKGCDQISFRTGLYKPLKEFPELLINE